MAKKQRLFTASAQIDVPSLFVAAHDEDTERVVEIIMGPINQVMEQVRIAQQEGSFLPGDPVLTITFDCKGEKA